MKPEIKERIDKINRGQVPEGYKKSKFGIIPEDWDIKKLKEVTDYVDYRGKTPRKVAEGVFLVTAKNIKEGYIDYNISKEYVSEEEYDLIMKRGKPKIGDVLFTTEAPLGNVAQVDRENIALAQRVIKFRGKNNLSNDYLKYYLLGEIFQSLLKNKAIGSTVLGIQGKQLHNLEICVPLIEEQQKIADILSTWDKAIELKEKLIEQKKELKKGLMQKLLTGEVRLPGFEGEWKEVKLKDLGVLKAGSAFPEKYQNQLNGKYPFFKVSDMNNEENEKYMLTANNYISEDIRTELKASVIPKNSIVFAKVGAALFLERKRLLKFDSCIDNNMMALVVKENIDFSFVYYLLLNMKLSRYSNVGALPSLNSKDVYSIKCKVPETFEEQKAISRFLSLFDKEISLLQNELLSIEQQKKGLMQLLLTGKVRVKV